jgi:hypothetical protein
MVEHLIHKFIHSTFLFVIIDMCIIYYNKVHILKVMLQWHIFYCFAKHASWCIHIIKLTWCTMYPLFILSVNRCLFQACYCPSSGGITVQHVLYKLLYIYSDTSWWWAITCLKHVEVDWWNKLFIYFLNCSGVDTQWWYNSTHLHTNSTQNTENGTYITIQIKKKLGSVGRAPSLWVIPWH